MKFARPPLKIVCKDLRPKQIFDLYDRLSLHFVDVEVFGETLYAANPLDGHHYSDAWKVLDKFGVTVI